MAKRPGNPVPPGGQVPPGGPVPPGGQARGNAPPHPVAAPPVPPPLRVVTSDNQVIPCRPEPFNSGSEGRLYFTLDGTRVVKIYSSPEPWRQASLEAIIRKRTQVMADNQAYWSAYYCWPEARIAQPGLGLVMRRASTDLRPLSHLLSPRFRARLKREHGPEVVGTWIGHVGIMIKLARTVSRLHNSGLCHSDLSPNNLLVNPQNGMCTLIDCDGLVEAESTILMPTVLGTPDYMAPELVSGIMPIPGKLSPRPTVETDLHALAVLIYQGLLFRHPLRGRAIYSPDPDEDERLLLGERALYIEHPIDSSNRPRTPFLTSAILGPEMQELCTRAFVDGLHAPRKRPLAAEWERALVRMYDQTVPCSNPACEARSFVLPESGAVTCPWCKVEVRGPARIPILYFYRLRQDGRHDSRGTYTLDFRFVGWHTRKLNLWHIEPYRMPGPNIDATPVGEIIWEPDSRQSRWWLVNRTIDRVIDITDDQHPVVSTASRIELRDGQRLKIGDGNHSRVIEIRLHRLS